MKVIGLTGTIGAGKDTVANYISESYGYKKISMGDILRKIADKEGLPKDRDTLRSLQNHYRRKYGESFFGEKIIKKVKNAGLNKVVISGMRTKEDVKIPKQKFKNNMILILVNASFEVRFNRVKNRRRAGYPDTIEDFKKQEKKEWELFDFRDIFDLADYKLDNSGSVEDLYKKIDNLLKNANFE